MRTTDNLSALAAVLAEHQPSESRAEIYLIDAMLVESVLDRPARHSDYHLASIERSLGRPLPVEEYSVKEVMRRYRMWLKEVRERGSRVAHATAYALKDHVRGKDPETKGTLLDSQEELFPWSEIGRASCRESV